MKYSLQTVITLTAVSGVLLFTSCKENVVRGKGAVTTNQRKVTPFDKVVLDMSVNAVIQVGKTPGVQITANNNLQEHIKTEVENGILRIHHDGIMFNSDDINVVINVPALNGLEINGASDADIKGKVTAANFELYVKGAAEVGIADIHVTKMNVKLSGASELNIASGIADQAIYKVTGAGEINARGLITKNVTAKVSGAGEMDLHVTAKLDAHITGAGEIDYVGHPQVTSKITGAGFLNDKN